MDKWKHEAKQKRIDSMIDKIVDYMLVNGFPPTQKEIARMCNINHSTVPAWVREAKAQGKMDTVGSGRTMGIMIPGVYYVDER